LNHAGFQALRRCSENVNRTAADRREWDFSSTREDDTKSFQAVILRRDEYPAASAQLADRS
jgi:hypothetical protein